MKIFRSSDLLEKSLAFVFVLIFFVFSIFFTLSNQEEVEAAFNHQRITFTKSLAREICDLLERRMDVSAKLSNVLAENSVAYAVLHLSDGSLKARSESFSLPVGTFETAEAVAMKAQYLSLIPFKDYSGSLSFLETAMPLFTSEGTKYILRLGFLRNDEEEELAKIQLRNILVFALVFVFFISLWLVRHLAYSSIKYALIGSTTLVMLILFFTASYAIRNWYGPVWRETFVMNECLGISKILKPSAMKLIEKKDSEEFESILKILSENENFCFAAVIKDDSYVYHRDKNKIGTLVEDGNYTKSLNSNKPSVFKENSQEAYYAMIPILNGSSRVGTLSTLWRSDRGIKAIASLRDRLTMIFVFSYLILFIFMHIFSEEISKRIFWLSQSREENYSFPVNSMELSEEKATFLPSNSNNRIGISVFLYFSGIAEAIEKIESDRLQASIKSCYSTVIKLLKNNKSCSIKLQPDGIAVLFYGLEEQEMAFSAIEYANLLKRQLKEITELSFLPKITFHLCNLVALNFEFFNGSESFAGDFLADYKSISSIQPVGEVVASQESYKLLKDCLKFDLLEIITPECGKFNAFLMGDYKDAKELSSIFSQSSNWTKLMILRILKSDGDFDGRILDGWEKENDPIIKDKLVKLREMKNNTRS